MDMMARRRALMSAGAGSGGGTKLLASGTYTKATGSTASMTIPVSFTGTPTQIFVYAPEPVESVAQTRQWIRQLYLEPEAAENFTYSFALGVYRTATGTQGTQAISNTNCILKNDNTELYLSLINSTYVVRDNTYKWYIWGTD